MKRFALWMGSVALVVGLLVTASSNSDPRQAIRSELPSLLPPGANLYLGFTDLRTDLQRLSGSELWQSYGDGANHESFIRSRLWLRFQDRLTQMETLVGAPLDGPGLSRLAASTCALAFYEVGDIEFVYVGRADLETELLAALSGMEGRFQEQSHDGETYRLVRDEMLGTELAWATAGGYVVVSDRESLLQTTLDRIGGTGPSLADDPGFHQVIDALPPDGDQLAYLNLARLRDDGYFRTYWMQKDRAVLSGYEAFGAAVTWEQGRATEHRFLAHDVPGTGDGLQAPDPTDVFAVLPDDALAAKAVATADPAEAAAVFLDGARNTGEPVDSFRTPLHDLLEAGHITRAQFDLLVGDQFGIAVLARPYDDTFTLLDRVVVTRPVDRGAAEVVLRQVRAHLPGVVTERLAGDVRQPFALKREQVLGVDVWTFDLYTRGVYAPSFAFVDGWLVMANSVHGVQAALEARSRKETLAVVDATQDLMEVESTGSTRQVLYLDVDTSREVYESVVSAMEKGDTFRSWSAQEFWTERMRDLLVVLGPVHGVVSWSSHTPAGLEGETLYLFEG
jgi:hypothetical protein